MNKDIRDLYDCYLLMESKNTPIISIDIQPAYEDYCSRILPDFINFLNSHRGDVYYFFNGSEVGIEDTADSISWWLVENGLDEGVLDRIIFREKYYAFFRNFMDMGMERSDLIKIIRYMVIKRITDSRDVSEEEFRSILGNNYDMNSNIIESDNIHIPDISIGELKKLSGCYLCGGGKDECLSEFRFLMEAFNIKYTLIDSLIY